jgi:hypothetical protein
LLNAAGRSPAEIAAEAEASMQALVDHSDTEPSRLQDALCDVLADVQERMERGGQACRPSYGLSAASTR